jgi:hypothetical protein
VFEGPSFVTSNVRVENASRIAFEVQRLLPNVHGGTLQFWGIWFGKPHDNYHVIQSAHAENESLVLEFDQKERLQIWSPRSWIISADEFSISMRREYDGSGSIMVVLRRREI